MKACVLSMPDRVEASPLQYRDLPCPRARGRDVLVRVHACGICRTDLQLVEGDLGPRKDHIIPGHQVAGVVEARGESSTRVGIGTRVAVPWLYRTCGVCEYCVSGAENLCESAEFTGYTVDGGYAEYMVATEECLYELPEQLTDVQAASLLCAGMMGFRALRLSLVPRGGRLGLYGFGIAGQITIQLARHWAMSVYVCTENMRQRSFAAQSGAAWVGSASEDPPAKLDGAVIFASRGELVAPALRALSKGSTLVLGGMQMRDIPGLPYELLSHERVIRSVMHSTRQDGREFLKLAGTIPIRTKVEVYPLGDANRALQSMKNGFICGGAVVTAG